MSDIIWTIIVIWLVYKVVGVFKNSNQKKSDFIHKESLAPNKANEKTKVNINKTLNNEGEYVDFEEVK